VCFCKVGTDLESLSVKTAKTTYLIISVFKREIYMMFDKPH
jgi:hypothetical protein